MKLWPLGGGGRDDRAGVLVDDDELEASTRVKGTLPLRPARGPLVRPGMRAKPARPVPSTTRQTAILATSLLGAPTSNEGTLIGRDRLSGSLVAHDPFTAYKRGTITSPNVVILGVIGSGKSSLNKTVYGLRQLMFEKRRVVVVDRKPRGDEGEYSPMVRRFGGQPFRMTLDGEGTRLNILDPVIYKGAGAEAQLRLLKACAEIARGDGSEPLDAWEMKALRIARATALRYAELEDRVPTLDDLVPRLGRLDGAARRQGRLEDMSLAAMERLHQAGMGLRFVLEMMLFEGDDALGGLFNGTTSPHVQLTSKLTSFDVSQLPDEGPAIPMTVVAANMWLMGVLRHQRGLHTTFLGEEGWHLVEGAGGRLMRSNTKLSRALGLSNVITMHHVADLPPNSPGMSLLKEAQTIHIYRQDRTVDVEAVMSMYNLSDGSRETLRALENGEHLMKIGNRTEVRVRHVRSALEEEITDTNEAMVLDSHSSSTTPPNATIAS